MGVLDGQVSDGHAYYVDCIPVIVENFINTWLAVLSACLCYKMLLENKHEVEQNGRQQREWTEYPSL